LDKFHPQKILNNHIYSVNGIFTLVGKISPCLLVNRNRFVTSINFVIIVGNGWKIISGYEEGQTQESCDFYTNHPVWDHPIDLHYTTQTIQNSPKLLLQVFGRDNYGRIIFLSYGVYNVPVSSGSYVLDCHTWKPIGICTDKIS